LDTVFFEFKASSWGGQTGRGAHICVLGRQRRPFYPGRLHTLLTSVFQLDERGWEGGEEADSEEGSDTNSDDSSAAPCLLLSM